MKTRLKAVASALALIALHLSPFALRLHAAVPLAWDVRPGQPAPVMFDRYHGETLNFSATFRGFGELPFTQDTNVRLWYQTNGMGRAWWSAPATIRSNILSAVWSPALDPGAERVSLFFGAPSNAYAAAVLRLRASPGFYPNVITPPPTLVDLQSGLAAFCATGTAFRAATIGTDSRWTDATGCVWEVATAYGWTIDYADPEHVSYDIHLEASGLGDGEYWVPYVGEAVSGVAKGNADSTCLVWENDAIADFSATRTVEWRTNLVGRALSTDTTQTTDPSVMLNDHALASARIVPDARPSAYWPNRQRVLRLGDDETVVTADRAEAGYLLVPDPDRLMFVDTVTVVGSGQTNYTFKTFRQYLNAVSPETMRELLRGYLPVEGGGAVTGDVTVAGDVTVTGALVAPNLVRVVTADIEANGFSVSNGVLRANSGLVVSNGMCKINCARAVIGIGTPRLHIEGLSSDAINGITFGGSFDDPVYTFNSIITNRVMAVCRELDFVSSSNASEIASMPVVTPSFRTGHTLQQGTANGIAELQDGKLNILGDSQYNANIVLATTHASRASVRFDLLLDYSSSVPAFYFDYNTFGDYPVFVGQTDAFSLTAGTPRLVHMRHLGNDRWIVTYEDLEAWSPPTNNPFVEEEP